MPTDDLKIILYPDARLRKMSVPIKHFDQGLQAIAARMFALMKEAGGVGLAAPQIGLNIRLFIANPTGKPEDAKAYVNPELSLAEGEETSEEGCLSLPGIKADILRAKTLRLRAQDLHGNSFETTETGYLARIWQHEFDHLNGTLITDRMGPTARMEAKRTLRDLEDRFADQNPPTRKKK